MTATFKIIALLSIVFASYASPKQQFIVVLDLSDRLLITNQPQKDQEIVMAVFEQFEAIVRKKLIIQSEDSFRVMIVPQADAANFDNLETALTLEMGTNIATKRTKLEAFKKNLPALLKSVYGLACKGKTKHSDFKGADIWKFFNDELPFCLEGYAQNHLYMLTDGYFDFESNRFVGKNGNRRTDSKMLSKFRDRADYRSLLLDKKEGLIPVKKDFGSVEVMVFEIKPKFQNLNEQDLLMLLWSKWLNEMNIRKHTIMPAGSIIQVKMKLKAF